MFEALNIGPKGHNYASKSIFRYGEQNEVMVARLRYDYTRGKSMHIIHSPKKVQQHLMVKLWIQILQ